MSKPDFAVPSERPQSRRLLRELLSPTRAKAVVLSGLKDLWNHRLRSFLTVLGIVFGVCSMIAMLAIGEGASYAALEQIRNLGSKNILLRSVKPPEDSSASMQDFSMLDYGLTYMDVDRIKSTIPSVQVKVPARKFRKDVWRGTNNTQCDIYGTEPSYPAVNNHRVASGRFFNRIELDAKANVCVLDRGIARKLFPLDSPIGGLVRIAEQYYHVIGVMEPKAARAAAGSGNGLGNAAGKGVTAEQDSTASTLRMYIPLTTCTERFGEVISQIKSGSMNVERVELHEVTVMVQREEDVVETARIIAAVLEYGHKKKDYEIEVPLALLRQAERTKQIFNFVLGGIAALSMLVGGIGIMNIMLASVTERTREIGIRRALGAKRSDIVIQFLVETVLLSGVGGLIGVALGLAIPFFVQVFAKMPTIVTFWSPVIAFSAAAVVGVVFGLYPALRAANMDPVEALRHE